MKNRGCIFVRQGRDKPTASKIKAMKDHEEFFKSLAGPGDFSEHEKVRKHFEGRYVEFYDDGFMVEIGSFLVHYEWWTDLIQYLYSEEDSSSN